MPKNLPLVVITTLHKGFKQIISIKKKIEH